MGHYDKCININGDYDQKSQKHFILCFPLTVYMFVCNKSCFSKGRKKKKRQIYFRKVINIPSPTRKLLVNKTLLQVWQSLNQNTMTSTIAQRLDRKGRNKCFFAPVFYHLFGKSLTKGKDFLERRQISVLDADE